MLDDLIDGLLEALYSKNIDECKRKYNNAVKTLKDNYAESRMVKVSELTRSIKEIDRNIKKVEYKTKMMNISDEAKKKIIEATINSFKEQKKKLRSKKRRISYRSM